MSASWTLQPHIYRTDCLLLTIRSKTCRNGYKGCPQSRWDQRSWGGTFWNCKRFKRRPLKSWTNQMTPFWTPISIFTSGPSWKKKCRNFLAAFIIKFIVISFIYRSAINLWKWHPELKIKKIFVEENNYLVKLFQVMLVSVP